MIVLVLVPSADLDLPSVKCVIPVVARVLLPVVVVILLSVVLADVDLLLVPEAEIVEEEGKKKTKIKRAVIKEDGVLTQRILNLALLLVVALAVLLATVVVLLCVDLKATRNSTVQEYVENDNLEMNSILLTTLLLLQEEPETSNILGVFGLSLRTREIDLEEVFREFGPIEKVTIVYDHRVRMNGFLYVVLKS